MAHLIWHGINHLGAVKYLWNSEIFDFSHAINLYNPPTTKIYHLFLLCSMYEIYFLFSLHSFSNNAILSLRFYMTCEGKAGSKIQSTEKIIVPSYVFMNKNNMKI